MYWQLPVLGALLCLRDSEMVESDATCAWDHDAFLRGLHVPDETAQATIAAIAQRTPQWHAERHGRLTASNFGAVAGHHVSGARAAALKAMLWPEAAGLTGRAAQNAEYGTRHESVALDIYCADRRARMARPELLRVRETGLVVSMEHCWLAASPDFLVLEPPGPHERDPAPPPSNAFHLRAPYVCDIVAEPDDDDDDDDAVPVPMPTSAPDAESEIVCEDVVAVHGCGEIKCPATLELYSTQPKHARFGMPHYHYDQVQGQMKLLGVQWCDYVVYTPTRTQVTRVAFNAEYWDKELFPALRTFYFHEFLPRLRLRHAGALEYGEVDPRLPSLDWLVAACAPSTPPPQADSLERACVTKRTKRTERTSRATTATAKKQQQNHQKMYANTAESMAACFGVEVEDVDAFT